MANPILFAGGEDIDFDTVLVPFGTHGVSIDTTSGDFRAGFARYGFDNLYLDNSGALPKVISFLTTAAAAFSSSNFWTSARYVCRKSAGATSNGNGVTWIQWLDASGIVRLRVRCNQTTSAALPPTTCVLEKLAAPVTGTNTGGFGVTDTLTFTSTPSGIFTGDIARDLSDDFIPFNTTVLSQTSTTVKLSTAFVRSPGNVIQFQSITQLGSSFSNVGSDGAPPMKVDFYINYAASGQFSFYQSGVLLFNYTGDVTTNSATALTQVQFGQLDAQSLGTVHHVWSEVIVATRDTRNMSLWTQSPVALGNTDTFTSGAAANVNGNSKNDNSPDYSITATQLQEYTATAAPSGSYSVITVQQTSRVTRGESGPQHIDFVVRTGGTDYPSSDLAPTLGWGRFIYDWDTNPNTTNPWQVSELVAAGFNLGYKSAT